MLTLAYFFIQVIISSGIMLLYYWLLLRNKKFHQYNRFYLLALFVLPWFVPLLKINLLPPKENTTTIIYFIQAIANNNTVIESKVKGLIFNWNTAVILTYILVCVFILIGLIKALLNIYRLLKQNSCKHWENIYLVFTNAKGTPFSFFKYIFWNNEIAMQSAEGKQILAHELIHVKQKHSLDNILIQIILIVGWCNPFFWLAKKEMNLIHEFIADTKVVKNGDASSLAAMLLAAAFPQQKFLLTTPFFFSPIKRRLAMITNTKNTKFSYARRIIALPVLFITVLLFSFRNTQLIAKAKADSKENIIIEDVYLSDIPNSTDSLSTEDLNLFSSKLNALAKTKTLPNGKTITTYERNDDEYKKLYALYKRMNQAQKDRFAVAIMKYPPIKKIVPTQEQLNNWKNENLYGLWIDGKHVNNNVLNNYKAPDFAHYDASKLYGAAKTGRKYSVQVNLATTKYYNEKYRKDSLIIIGYRFTPPKIVRDDTMKVKFTPPKIVRAKYTKAKDNNGVIKFVADSFYINTKGNLNLNNALIIVDGKEVLQDFLNTMPPNSIQTISILKDSYSAVKKYGAKAKNGVIEITTKPNNKEPYLTNVTLEKIDSNNYNVAKNEQPNIVFTTVLIAAEFPGGKEAWQKFLQKNLNANIPVDKGCPPGKYIVNLTFTVNEKGEVSNIKALNNPGYGTKEEAIRVMQNSPNWLPAVQNGHKVNSIVKKSITFQISEE
ncbi:MAG: energy transducer TonB [Bacteroidetes bacterium]|nr:energy transducer TonB [Bacteroidota bacterium]